MKNYLFFLGLVLCQLTNAQLYSPVPMDTRMYFKTDFMDMGDYDECNGPDCLIGIKVDSVSIDGDNFYFHFMKMMRGEVPYCASDSWLGGQVMLAPGGDYLFENNLGEFILLRPSMPIGESWYIYDLNDGTYLSGKVEEVYEADILGLTDSVARIEITRLNGSGDVLDHPFNGKHILMSQQNGFVQTYDFYHFPQDTFPKVLAGFRNPIPHGIVTPLKEQIFNFAIGNEYHYQTHFYDDFPPDPHITERWERLVVLDKTLSANDDTIHYLMDRTFYEIDDPLDGTSPEVSFVHDTFTQTIILPKFVHFDNMPFEPNYLTTTYDLGFYSSKIVDGHVLSKTINYLYFEENENCFYPYVGTGIFTESYWSDCLGHYRTDAGNPSNWWKQMIYYKKGPEEWGTPIDFDSLTVVRNPVLPDNSFRVYPNPANDYLRIASEDFRGTEVYAEFCKINGQMIFSEALNFFEETELPLPKLIPGVYFLKLRTEEGIYVQKVMLR